MMGWLGASVVFYGLVGLLGGPTEGDASETVYSTWSIAHGNLGCAYPKLATYHFDNLANPFALTAPLYTLITGAASALLRIGHSVEFPTQHQLGPSCDNAFVAMFHWSVNAGAILPTVRLSYLMWPVLVVGVIALLGAAGRGRQRWEPLALLMVACTPTAWMCLTYFFHPEDLLAMGFIFAGVACSLRKRWFWAGVLLGLACSSQQFAFLVAAPLLVVATGRQRIRYLAGAVVTVAIIDIPIIVATSGRAIRTLILGSSRVGVINRSTGGTVLWETDLRGIPLFLLSRVAPIAASMALAWWASKRLGPRILSPVPLISLLASSLAFRLIFEENLFGYYFMAVSVALIVLDVARGQVRGTVLAWIALVTVAFNPVHAGFLSNMTGHTLELYYALPIVVLGIVAATVVVDAVYRRIRVYKLVWIVVVLVTCESKLYGQKNELFNVPHWLWQVVLAPIALGLALKPLLTSLNAGASSMVAEESDFVSSS
ncbi:MAG TPA: hypothetical protein VNF05_10060 [Acidimicrobiales bacterium]|nr:hypothetical protein [Acidimicrobiales bacterium]